MRIAALLLSASLMAGCNSTGKVQVFVAAEDTIPEGLMAGTGAENIKDGWSVTYEKFTIAIGNYRASRSANPSDKLSDPTVKVVDLMNLPAGGMVVTTFDNVAAARWDKFGFDLTSVDFEATLENPSGQSCKPTAPTDCVPRTSLKIKWAPPAATAFDDCAPPEGDAGFAVPTGGTVQIKPTIHGDHWFFSDITQGVELTDRLAQWIADCDLDRNGETTLAELKQVRASDVFPAAKYNLTGAIIPINTAYDYLEAQARTLGDYQGEGECPTRRVLP